MHRESHPRSRCVAAFCILCTVLCFVGAPAARAQIKIGVVHMDKVYAAYYKVHRTEKMTSEARELAKKELDERMESHRRTILSSEGNDKGGQVHDTETRLRPQIIEEIMRVVTEKAQAGKYDLVLDIGGPNASGLRIILSTQQTFDLSDEIIAVLNKGH